MTGVDGPYLQYQKLATPNKDMATIQRLRLNMFHNLFCCGQGDIQGRFDIG